MRNFTRKLELLARRSGRRPEDMRLLEIGCATGEFLRVARAAGVTCHLGIEPSAYCREIATRRGLEVLSPSDPGASAAIASLEPTVVVAWDVWEHLPHPARELDAVLAHASPDVTVALSTVDASSFVAKIRGTRWRQFHPPTHLNYPTRRSLEHYLASRGFTVRHHASFGYYRPLLEYARALGMDPRQRADGWNLPWTFPLYLNLWDIQLVIATRGQA
ncbi:class I SAM-dependent methyltransferase [Anaeromyxobacter sp. Fw109-5]|uniref:class I SAM-dependent methyltransferase n=1 Tax=Anaeromyxobacter sp. (strain Fw109-5) TaxID=404589 RepID=UPI000312EC85|nr:class I SAM-dependent methyltransferase [Anaeromyxobacter sp. Fw109-5]